MIKISSFWLDKKRMIMIAGGVLAVFVLCLLMAPLVSKVRRVGREVKALEEEMAAARQAIKSEGKFRPTGKLLTRRKVSLAIDEITKAGAAKNVSFLSISPQPIITPKGSKYPALPIKMDLQCAYHDLGAFLGALEKLEESIVTVKSLEIGTDSESLPQLETVLVVEVHLQEGEDG
jgi:Tfp pilus assembly protein PilO